MSGQIRAVLARKLLEVLGDKTPKKSQLDKTTWCVRSVRAKKGVKNHRWHYSTGYSFLESCGIHLPGETPTEKIKAGQELAKTIACDDLIKEVDTKNHYVFFRLDESIYRKDILHDVVRKGKTAGLDGIQYKFRFDPELQKIIDVPQNERVIVEYGSPNIAKPFHAGHLRSTVLGQVIANLNEALGHTVSKINYLGDWGTQYGYLGLAYEKYGSDEQLQQDPLQHLFDIYVRINQGAQQDETIHPKAKEFFNKMDKGDKECLPLWKKFRDISIEEYTKLYERLGVKYDEYHGESMYGERCRQLIDSLKERNILEINPDTNVGYVDLKSSNSQNALYANLVKSDGSTLYLTRDIAAFLHRREDYKFDRIHYVVEHGQSLHFTQLQEVLAKIGEPVAKDNMSSMHVKFGRVSGMSTRKGEVVFLKDLLDEARDRMLHAMKSTRTTKVVDNLEEVADILGVSAIIVQDIKQKRGRNYKFDWENMLRFVGDTGVNLQYAHARLVNLEKNCGVPLNIDCNLDHLDEEVAQKVIHQLGRFDEAVYEAFIGMEPYHITSYLFNLGKFVNAANQQLRVKDQPADVAEARLLLFHCSRLVLANGMKLLGLQPLDKL